MRLWTKHAGGSAAATQRRTPVLRERDRAAASPTTADSSGQPALTFSTAVVKIWSRLAASGASSSNDMYVAVIRTLST